MSAAFIIVPGKAQLSTPLPPTRPKVRFSSFSPTQAHGSWEIAKTPAEPSSTVSSLHFSLTLCPLSYVQRTNGQNATELLSTEYSAPPPGTPGLAILLESFYFLWRRLQTHLSPFRTRRLVGPSPTRSTHTDGEPSSCLYSMLSKRHADAHRVPCPWQASMG